MRTKRDLVPDTPHRYAVPAPQEVFLNLRIDADPEMEFEASILNRRSEIVAEARLPRGGGPRHILIAHLDADPEYQLRVTSDKAGSYELRVNELRPARPGDRDRVEGLVQLYLARTLFERGHPQKRYRQALELLRRAELELAEVDPAYRAYAILQQANAHLYLQDNDAAMERLTVAQREFEALREERATPHPYLRWLAEAYGAQAGILRQSGRPAEALRLFDRAVEVYESGGPEADWGLALFLNNRAFALAALGRTEGAEKDFLRAMEVASRQSHLAWIGWAAQVNLADLYRRQGRLAEALTHFQHAEEQLASSTSPYPFEELLLSASLGRFYLITGRLEEARKLLDQALALAREQEDLEYEQKTLQSLALLNKALGDLEGSLLLYEQAARVAQQGNNPALTAETLLEWGRTLRLLGYEEEATDRFSRALEIARATENPALHVHVLATNAKDFLVRQQPQKAALLSARAVETARQSARGLLAISLIVHAEALLLGGHGADAEQQLAEALTLSPENERPLLYAEAQIWAGRTARARGDLHAAQRLMGDGLRVFEKIRGKLDQPASRTRFLSQRLDLYDELIEILVELERRDGGHQWVGLAMEVSERSRSRTMADLLTRSRIDFRGHGVDPEVADREEFYRDVLTLYYGELSGNPSLEDEGRAATLSRSLSETRKTYREIERRIRAEHPSYADLRFAEPLGAQDMQDVIPDGTALLHYSLGAKRSHLFVLRAGAPLTVFDLPGEEEIHQRVSQISQNLNGWDIRSRNRFADQVRDLYLILVAPAERLLADVEHLKVIPDGALHAFPFGMLLAQDGRFAIERWSISYAPSVTVMATLQRRSLPDRWSPSLIAFAGPQGGRIGKSGSDTGKRGTLLSPLPGTIEEARSIAQLFPGRSRIYLGAEAHQDNVLHNGQVSNARWIHFASHGLIDENLPMNSGIVLSPNRAGDDMLQVSEVFGLRLSSEVVVLSACRTGLGKRIAGEGILGLSRAFFYAGTQNVVVSMWAVSDRSTARLMEAFYAGMAAGKTPASSLREAKVELINEGFSPRLWAPFIITGVSAEPSALPERV